MNTQMKEKMKFASILSVALCTALTIGYAAGGGDFKGPSVAVYFVMFVVCIALAVNIALEGDDQ